MQIDRSNYEVWLIDWLDGKLDEIQIQNLLSFLNDNPDLREEYEEAGIFRLSSQGNSYPHKNQLKKTASDLTDSQFDLLCAAYLENDLLPQQIQELDDAKSNDPEKTRSFELIQKTKLIPAVVSFKGKQRLIRRTLRAKIIRLSVTGLSAAAMIAIGLFIFNSGPDINPDRVNTAQEVKIENRDVKEEVNIAEKKVDSRSNKKAQATGNPYRDLPENSISDVTPAERPLIIINKIALPANIDLKSESPRTLIALNTDIPIVVEERSRVSRMIAKTFREKILNEPAPRDNPLKAVEIAEAGITGLNKILGWEMALGEKSDDEGKTQKIYFSSRILKINAPANKSEPEL